MGKINGIDYEDRLTKRAVYQSKIETIKDPICRYVMQLELDKWPSDEESGEYKDMVSKWENNILFCWGVNLLYVLLSLVTLTIFFWVYNEHERSHPFESISFRLNSFFWEIKHQDDEYDKAESDRLARPKPNYDPRGEDDFKELIENCVMSVSERQAKDFIEDAKFYLSPEEEKLLASLPLQYKMDADIESLKHDVKTLCARVSDKALSDNELSRFDLQCKELKEQTDILKEAGSVLFDRYDDWHHYFNMERSLLQLNFEEAKKSNEKAKFLATRELANPRIAQFRTFANAIANKVFEQKRPLPYKIDKETLVECLLNAPLFIAYVVKKNSGDYVDAD